jgi:hypothetical protein
MIYDNAEIFGFSDIYGEIRIRGNSYISCNEDYCVTHGFGKYRICIIFKYKVGNTYEVWLDCGSYYGNVEGFMKYIIDNDLDYKLEHLLLISLIKFHFKIK